MDAVTINIANPAAQIAALDPQQRYNGVNYLVVFRLEHGATNLTAVKAISISERETLNRNPEIEKIVFDKDEADKTLDPVDIDVSFTAAGEQEIYTEMSADGSIDSMTESYFITWFYHLSKIKPSRILFGQQSKYQSNLPCSCSKCSKRGTAVNVFFRIRLVKEFWKSFNFRF